MSDLKICRICLRTRCKVYKYDQYQLKLCYEAIMGQQLKKDDGLPHHFCYECASLLGKYNKFKQKCHIGQKTLKKINMASRITYEAIHKIDRVQLKLKSSLEVMIVTERVKTFLMTDNTTPDYNNDSPEDSDWALEEKEISLKDIKDSKIFCDEGSKIEEDHHENHNNEENDDDFNNDYVDNDYGVTNAYESEFEATDDFKQAKSDGTHTIEESNVAERSDVEKVEDAELKNDIDDDLDEGDDDEPLVPKEVLDKTKKKIQSNKSEPAKERKKRAVRKDAKSVQKKEIDEFGLKKQNPNFRKQKTRFLDMNSWEKYNLTEEDAVQDFQNRANDSKYQNAQYKCDDCFKGFSRHDILVRHKQLTHAEHIGKLECRFCHKRFKWDCKLRKHMRSHFVRYKCLVCHIVLSEEYTALLHEDYHKGVKKICKHCGEEFKHPSTYYTHLRTHRSDYVCTLCGMSFVSELGLHNHKRIMHVNNDIESGDDDEEVNTFCEKCNIRFETRPAFVEHLFHSAMHTEGAEEEAPEDALLRKVFSKKTKDSIKDSLKRKHNSDEELSDDKKIIAKKGRRARMRRMHKKPTTCYQCGKYFQTQADCMKHHLQEHPRTSFFPESERYICEICGASLAPGSIKMHQNIHTKEKEYPCETCGRRFHSSVGLKRHMVSHTGEKPFACTLCDKRFTQSNSMKLHYRTFHLKLPYPKREVDPEMYAYTMARKREYPCETCGRRFKQSITLKRHLVVHTGEKPYGCPLCDKRFTQNNSMKLHYRTFHLKMPYPKRNRRKKGDHPGTAPLDKSSSESEDELPPPPPPPVPPAPPTALPPPPAHGPMHYLTLS